MSGRLLRAVPGLRLKMTPGEGASRSLYQIALRPLPTAALDKGDLSAHSLCGVVSALSAALLSSLSIPNANFRNQP